MRWTQVGKAEQQALLTVDEYLSHERHSQIKHEYTAGRLFAMAGASERHNRVCMNLGAQLHAATRLGSCVTYMSDMRLRIDQVVYYPDLMVCCEESDNDPYIKHAPCLVVEVLSDSTERIDRGEKLYNYRQVPSLQCYLLLSQDRVQADLYQRNEAGQWLLQTWTDPSDELALPCVSTPVSLAQVYERIVFDD